MENEILQQILSELKELRQGQAKLEQEVRHNRILLEDTQRDVKTIAQSHGDLNRKLDALNDYPETKSDVEMLKTVVSRHSSDIALLKKAN